MARRRRRKGGLYVALRLCGALAMVFLVLRGADLASRKRSGGAVPWVHSVLPSQGPLTTVAPDAALPAEQAGMGTPFASFEACEAYVKGHPRVARRGARIGSWNIRWFPQGTSHGDKPEERTDLPWLACAIASLDVDVLAVQEITQGLEGRSALLDVLARLDAYTHGAWQAELDDCSGSGRQHVGFLFDTRHVQLSDLGPIAGLNPGNSACALNLRPGFGAYGRFPNGPDLWLVAVHLDSGLTARDFDHRVLSVSRLADVATQLAAQAHDSDLLVLGDFNTMGCKGCEGGDVTAAEEIARIDATLHAGAFTRVPMRTGLACSHYYRGHAGLLDHVVTRAGTPLLASGAHIELHGLCADLGCDKLARTAAHPAIERLSDHCPIVVELAQEQSNSPMNSPATRDATRR